MFPLPWRVEVNPFGPPSKDGDNIFVFDAEGSHVCVMTKHPVWRYMNDAARLEAANRIVAAVNTGGKP